MQSSKREGERNLLEIDERGHEIDELMNGGEVRGALQRGGSAARASLHFQSETERNRTPDPGCRRNGA